MLIRSLFVSAVLAVFSSTLPAQDQDKEKQDPPLAEKIQTLVRDLGSDEYTVREHATEELKKIGQPAMPALEKAAKDTDLERARRAKEIIDAVKSGSKPSEIEQPPQHQDWSGGRRGVQRKSVRVVNGKIQVTVWDAESGKEQLYEADSIEEFNKKYPELSKQLGFSIQIERKNPREKVPENDPIERHFEEFERWIDDMRKMLDDDFFFREFGRGDNLEELMRRWRKEFEEVPKKLEESRPKAKKKLLPSGDRLEAKLAPVDEESRKHFELKEGAGALVTEVEKGRNADKCGLKAGDIIVSINSGLVEGPPDARRRFAQALRGKTVEFSIIRNGSKQSLSVSTADVTR